jgi:hypothetical protein
MRSRPATFPRRSVCTAARVAIGAILTVALATSCTSPTAPGQQKQVPRATSPNGSRSTITRPGHLNPDTLEVKATCDWVNPWVC